MEHVDLWAVPAAVDDVLCRLSHQYAWDDVEGPAPGRPQRAPWVCQGRRQAMATRARGTQRAKAGVRPTKVKRMAGLDNHARVTPPAYTSRPPSGELGMGCPGEPAPDIPWLPGTGPPVLLKRAPAEDVMPPKG